MRRTPNHFRSKSNENSSLKRINSIETSQSRSVDMHQPHNVQDLNTSSMSLPLLLFDQISPNQNSSSPPRSLYYVSSYDESCIEESKIDKIICVKLDDKKYLFFCVLCFLTCFIIAIISELLPRLKIKLKFKESTLKHCTHLIIYGRDNVIYIIDIFKINLPQLHNNCNILNFTKSPITASKTRLFEFKMHKYAFNDQKKAFVNVKFSLNATFDQICRKMTCGLTNEETDFQRSLYQFQSDDVLAFKSLFKLFLNEITNPFYIAQLFCVCFWLRCQYSNYALVLIAVTISTLFLAIFEIKLNLDAISKISKYSCDVVVYRIDNGERKAKKVNSEELLPGDIFEIPSENIIIPCDALLINGNVIINESFLTGESNPIFKSHIPNSNDHFNPKADNRYILFSGTRIIQSRNKAMGLVIGIGTNTEKGNLIRAILFKDSGKEDNWEIWKLICIICIIGICLISFSLKAMIYFDFPFGLMLYKFFDLVSTILSPALPGCVIIGISICLLRMKKKGINCLNMNKINVVGSIDLIVFDKTGTLTEDHIDLYGFKLISYTKGKYYFDPFIEDLTSLLKETYKFYKRNYLLAQSTSNANKIKKEKEKRHQMHMYAIECIACCNSITKIDNKLIGDPIDLEMFQSTNWEFEETINNDPILIWFRPKQEASINEVSNKQQQEEDILQGRYDIGIIRRFDFVSKLQRMTVIAKNINENFFKVFCKGSPEKICELCRPETVPPNYDKTLKRYTNQGLRVIAMCFKMLKMDFIQSQKIARESIEHGMIFLGFFIVANKLRPKTKDTIDVIQEAEIKTIIATGDNVFTAASVGRECHIIPEEQPIYKCEMSQDKNNTSSYHLTFNEIIIEANDDEEEEEEEEDDESNLSREYDGDSIDNALRSKRKSKLTHNLSIDTVSESDIESESDGYEETDIHLIIKHKPSELKTLKIDTPTYKANSAFAVSGSTFEMLYNLSRKVEDDPSNNENQAYKEIFELILKMTLIYGRMTPENKTLLIDCLKKSDYCVAMCGDGANDIGALRSANVGISLGLDATSISAPFICESSEIKCIIRILCEGKACQSNTIECYKYMILLSFIQFFASLFLLRINSNLSGNQCFLTDFFIIFPMVILISRSKAIKLLTNDRPPLLNVRTLLMTIIPQSIVAAGFQYVSYYLLITRLWYKEYIRLIPVDEDGLEPSIENTILFLISYLQSLIVVTAIITGKPFKESPLNNKPFLFYLVALLLIGYYLILVPNGELDQVFQLVDINDQNLRFGLILITIANFLVSFYLEKEFIPFVNKWILKY